MTSTIARAAITLAIIGYPTEAFLSGPVSVDARTPHFLLGQVTGPSISFADSESEAHYHQEHRDELRPALEQLGASLETSLAHLDPKTRAIVLPYGDYDPNAAEVDGSPQLGDAERDLVRYAYSPYARHLVRQLPAPPSPPLHDRAMTAPFQIVFGYATFVNSIQVRARIAANPSPAQLATLERAIRAVAQPPTPGIALRAPSSDARIPAAHAAPIDTVDAAASTLVVRTNHVELRVIAHDVAGASIAITAADTQLAHRLARRLEAELAAIHDDIAGELTDGYACEFKRGAFRLTQDDLGNGFTSPWLAEVPGALELHVRLRTVETDRGGSLDRALLDRMFALGRAELAGLKRLDMPDATSAIGADDWVLVHKPT